MDDILKTRGIIYSNVEIWLLLAPLSNFLATRQRATVSDRVASQRLVQRMTSQLLISLFVSQSEPG